MRKILFLLIACLLVINVKAEERPVIVSHKVMVTNKEGTTCYKDSEKTDIVIPYKTMLIASYDISGSYINVYNDDYNCDVKYSDVSSNTQKFSVDDKNVTKINPVRSIVLSSTGLNLRIGPSVTYAKIMTIPQNTVLTLSYKAGTYWYYTEYNNKAGWVTAMNMYLGYDYNKVLVNYEKTSIYNNNGTKVLGSIPANTEITDYVKLDNINDNGLKYYINYNGIKGYIRTMLFKTNGRGKIKLVKDVDIKDDNGNPIKRMSSGSELEYTMVDENNNYYFPSRNRLIKINSDEFEYINEARLLIKQEGYLGEGIFGEEKMEREEIVDVEEKNEEVKGGENTKKTDITTIVIICLLSGIFVLLIVLVIIKLFNSKKKNNVIVMNKSFVEESKNE